MNLDGYLLCIIATTLFTAVLTAIIPEGKTSGVIKGTAKLVCLLAIISPIPHFLQKQSFFDLFEGKKVLNNQEEFVESVIQTDESFIKYFRNMKIRLLEEEIAREIEFSYAVNCTVLLDCTINENTATIIYKKITVKPLVQISNDKAKEITTYLKKYDFEEVKIE